MPAPDGRDVTITALARAVCLFAAQLPGSPAALRQILTSQMGLSSVHADAIITAAERLA